MKANAPIAASAPVSGVVIETLYAKGDWVPAGAPVLVILPVDKIKVSFEVPLAVAVHLQNGRGVTLVCAQCDEPVRATITSYPERESRSCTSVKMSSSSSATRSTGTTIPSASSGGRSSAISRRCWTCWPKGALT